MQTTTINPTISLTDKEIEHLKIYLDDIEATPEQIEEAYHHDNNSFHSVFPDTVSSILYQVLNMVKFQQAYE